MSDPDKKKILETEELLENLLVELTKLKSAAEQIDQSKEASLSVIASSQKLAEYSEGLARSTDKMLQRFEAIGLEDQIEFLANILREIKSNFETGQKEIISREEQQLRDSAKVSSDLDKIKRKITNLEESANNNNQLDQKIQNEVTSLFKFTRINRWIMIALVVVTISGFVMLALLK
jgi:hypothetical protein